MDKLRKTGEPEKNDQLANAILSVAVGSSVELSQGALALALYKFFVGVLRWFHFGFF